MKIRSMTAGTLCYHLRRLKKQGQHTSDYAKRLASALRKNPDYRVPNDVWGIVKAIT